MSEIDFAGNGASELGISKDSTSAPDGAKGSVSSVEFAGNGASDCFGFSADTKNHDASCCEMDKSSGKGVEFVS
jgi:hypothetical protein